LVELRLERVLLLHCLQLVGPPEPAVQVVVEAAEVAVAVAEVEVEVVVELAYSVMEIDSELLTEEVEEQPEEVHWSLVVDPRRLLNFSLSTKLLMMMERMVEQPRFQYSRPVQMLLPMVLWPP
jgi:hypothetical protein